MSQCGMDFQSIPLHITYNFQQFEPIQYANGLYIYIYAYSSSTTKIHDFFELKN
jgi:hypothetical protein